MKGIILAGGHGTRLKPLTDVTNKHLIAVYDKPMIDYPISTLMGMGISEIMIISGRDHAGHFLEYLGSGADRGLDLTYRVQEGAGGIAQALGLAEKYIGNADKFAVILGDNIFGDIPSPEIQFGKSAKIFLKFREGDASRFGIAMRDDSGEIISIVEKPKNAVDGYVVTGLYVYPSSVFSVVAGLKPSDRGELEITDVNEYFVKNRMLDYETLSGFWTDAGTPESLAKATEWAISNAA